jgi:hypothetical protein
VGLSIGQKAATVTDPPVVGVVVRHAGGFVFVQNASGVHAYRPAQLEPYSAARLLERAARKIPQHIETFTPTQEETRGPEPRP